MFKKDLAFPNSQKHSLCQGQILFSRQELTEEFGDGKSVNIGFSKGWSLEERTGEGGAVKGLLETWKAKYLLHSIVFGSPCAGMFIQAWDLELLPVVWEQDWWVKLLQSCLEK